MKYQSPSHPIMEKQFQKMEHKNPFRRPSHPVCDWVIENFTDLCIEAGYEGPIEEVVSFWNRNQ